MAGRPPCLWTCLSSLVKPVDLGNIKTAIYEKAWNKTHKHPATETINTISSPKEPFYKMRESESTTNRSCERRVPPCTGVAQSRCSDYTQVHFLYVRGFYLRALGVSAGLWQPLNFSLRNGEAKQTELSAFRSKTEPQNHSLACGSQHSVPALTSPKTNTLRTSPPQPERIGI